MVKYDYMLEHNGLYITFYNITVDKDGTMWFMNCKGDILCSTWKNQMQLSVDCISHNKYGNYATVYFKLVPNNNMKGGD